MTQQPDDEGLSLRDLIERGEVRCGHIKPRPGKSCDWHIYRMHLWFIRDRPGLELAKRSRIVNEAAPFWCSGEMPEERAVALVELA